MPQQHLQTERLYSESQTGEASGWMHRESNVTLYTGQPCMGCLKQPQVLLCPKATAQSWQLSCKCNQMLISAASLQHCLKQSCCRHPESSHESTETGGKGGRDTQRGGEGMHKGGEGCTKGGGEAAQRAYMGSGSRSSDKPGSSE